MKCEDQNVRNHVYDFGLRLKELREKRGLSQVEVARRIHIDKNTISRYERNIRNPQFDILVKLAVFYNASLDYILGIADRTNIYIDDMSEKNQRIITRTIETMKEERNQPE